MTDFASPVPVPSTVNRTSKIVCARPTNLEVGAADAPAERSADAVADEVVRRLAAADQEPSPTPSVATRSPRIRRSSIAAAGDSAGPVSDRLDAEIRAARAGGTPMREPIRRRMEQGFGADFSGVRLHTDRRADRISRVLGAEAFTLGTDVFGRTGRLDGSSAGSESLLAHELAHVTQNEPTRIRRRIGFEFEDNEWRVWKDPMIGAIRPAKRHEKVHIGTDYHIEGDDGQGVANLEVVTEPFDITNNGLADLDAAMNDVRVVMGRIGNFAGRDETQGNYVVSNEHQFSKSRVRLSGGNANGQFKMQTTMGLALEDLPTLMEYTGHNVPGEAAPQGADRSESRMIQTGAVGGDGTISNAIGQMPSLARVAVARLQAAGNGLTLAQRAVFAANNAALIGFLSQVILYVKFLSITHNDYLKAKIPLMARTNFAALHAMLPQNQRASLALNNAQAFVDAVVHACNSNQLMAFPGGFHDQNFAGNVSLVRNLRLNTETLRDPAAPPPLPGQDMIAPHRYKAFQSLTIAAWLEGITLNVDRLTPSTMNQWLKAHEVNLPAKHRKRHVSNLESFATLGGQTDQADRAGTTNLGIFENRSIAPKQNPLTPQGLMTAHQAHTAAHHYLEWLIGLKANGVPGAFPNAAVP